MSIQPHHHSPIRRRAALLLAGGLTVAGLAACGSTDDASTVSATTASSSQDSVTVTELTTTQASATTATEPSTATVTNTVTAQPSLLPNGTVGPIDYDLAERLDRSTPVGGRVDVEGTPATVCVFGDGYGLNIVAAGGNASCELATGVLDELSAGLNATDDNLRLYIPRDVLAYSAATNQRYTMGCSMQGNLLITCRGGDNALVFLY